LQNLIVGVNVGGTNEAFADSYLVQVRKFDRNGEQLEALLAGEVAAVVTDVEEAAWWLHTGGNNATYCRSPAILEGTGTTKAILLPRGDNPLKRYVDFWLEQNRVYIEALYQKYLPQT